MQNSSENNSSSEQNLQVTECSFSDSIFASSQADLDNYGRCNKLSGDLVIIAGSGVNSLSLPGVVQINGSLSIVDSPDLTSFSADSLESISGTLNMTSLTSLRTSSFGSLEKVGSIYMVSLPNLESFATRLESADNIVISDTGLRSVEGFESLESVKILNINNNRQLSKLNYRLKSVSNSIDVSFNGRDTNATFAFLEWVNNITLRDVKSVDLPELEKVNSSLGLIECTFSSVNLPKLSEVGGTLSVIHNNDLTDIDFNNLVTVGGAVVIANNTRFSKIDGIPNLEDIGSALVVQGSFNELDLHSLKSVKGGAQIITNSANYSCDSMHDLQRNGGIQGRQFVCNNGVSSISSRIGSSTTSRTSRNSTSASSRDDASNFVPSSFFGAFAALAMALL